MLHNLGGAIEYYFCGLNARAIYLKFLRHHTRTICSMHDTIRDQYHNTENDDDFN